MLLNSDLGESFGAWKMGDDAAIMPYIDQANIACGYHAGDPCVMQMALSLAKQHTVEIGAHVSYPDQQGFGRRSMKLGSNELIAMIQAQIATLDGLAKCQNSGVTFVKPHGALYNDMMLNDVILSDVMTAASSFYKPLKLVVQSGMKNVANLALAKRFNLDLVFEGFADRAYTNEGLLVPRSSRGAVLSKDEAMLQAECFMQGRPIKSITGKLLDIKIDTLCVHSDSPSAIEMCVQIRQLIAAKL